VRRGRRTARPDRGPERWQNIGLTEAVTGGRGKYRATFTADTPTKLGKERLDLQARVYSRDGNSFPGASNVCYNAAGHEILNVLLPEQAAVALPSQYETLLGVLAAQYRGDLADLKETAGQQDITYLANKTGWDAKAVAFAALAEQFSRITVPLPRGPRRSRSKRTHRVRRPRETVNLKPELYYALFRAGLPANADGLFQITPKTARSVWEESIKQGLIPQTFAGELDSAARSFESLSAVHTLDANPPIGIYGSTDGQKVRAGATLKRYQQIIDSFLAFLGTRAEVRPEAVTTEGFTRFRDLLLEQGRAPRTVNIVVRKILKRPFTAAVNEGFIQRNPISSIRHLLDVTVEKGVFTPPQIAQLVEAAVPDWKGLILAGYYTGARLGDLARRTWASVDMAERTITLRQKKTGAKIKVPLHSAFGDYLQSLLGSRSIPADKRKPLFPTLYKKPRTKSWAFSGE
jgi:hypothetical protein